jgi:hypothetical protein
MTDGGKWLVRKKQRVAYWRYYVYNNHKLMRCLAKYTVIEWPNGKVETEFDLKPHNHDPPSTLCIKKEAREHIKMMINAGASLATIQKKCVNKTPLPLSSADIPSMFQLKNAKYSSKNRRCADEYYDQTLVILVQQSTTSQDHIRVCERIWTEHPNQEQTRNCRRDFLHNPMRFGFNNVVGLSQQCCDSFCLSFVEFKRNKNIQNIL